MNGKDLKSNSNWLNETYKETIEGKKGSLEDLQKTEHLIKLENEHELCSFVAKCITEAQQEKMLEKALKNSTTSKENSYPSMFGLS